MKSLFNAQTPAWPFLAWLCVALAGVAAPALTMLVLADPPAAAPHALVGGPILAVGLMGAAMIAAAAAGRMWVGVLLGLLTGAGLLIFARTLGMSALVHPLSTALAVIVASVSFAARGTLFARSASDKGWLIALAVVAGEAAMVFTATASPGLLPDWLLVLLPAQWASAAIQTSLTGTGAGSGTRAASSVLIALAGTAAATLLVARLWPRRWPYLIMFTAWLGLSALVWHWPAA